VVEKSIRCVQAKKDTGLVQAWTEQRFSATCRGIMGRISLGKAVEGEKKAGCPAFSCYDYMLKIIAWKAGSSEAFLTVSHALRGLPLPEAHPPVAPLPGSLTKMNPDISLDKALFINERRSGRRAGLRVLRFAAQRKPSSFSCGQSES